MAEKKNWMSKVNTQYLSGLLGEHPSRCFEMLLALVDSFDNVPIISVGCGNGYLEAYLKAARPKRTVLGVDPDPNNYAKIPDDYYRRKCLKPCASTLDKGELDHYIDNNILLLNWPDPNNSTYDIEAIFRMKPRAIFINYGPCGSSGSEALIDMLGGIEVDRVNDARSEFSVGDLKYKLIESFTGVVGTGMGFIGKTFRVVSYSLDFSGEPKRESVDVYRVISPRSKMLHELLGGALEEERKNKKSS
jgi:SAM-dependent methyltransferase